MLNICKRLFSSWNKNAVKYCHWKSNEHLEAGLNGETDLDVYVDPTDASLTESLLDELGFLETIPQKANRYPKVSEWIGYDTSTGKLVHVHLHYRVITGTKFCKEYVFPIEDKIVSTRVLNTDTGLFVMNPNLEIIVLYSRIVLKSSDKKHIKPGKDVVKEIKYLKQYIDEVALAELCNELIGKGGNRLSELICQDDLSEKEWYEVYSIVLTWLRPYKYKSSIEVFFRYRYFKIKGRLIHLLNKKFDSCIIEKKTVQGNGPSICLLGQDGSGKSTITIELCNWLGWKLSAKRFYLGSGEHYKGLFKWILRGRKDKKGSSKNEKSERSYCSDTNKVQKSKKNNIKNLVVATLYALEKVSIAHNAYRQVKRAARYSKKGGIPLFDRFPQNQFLGLYDGPKIEPYYEKTGLDYCLVRTLSKLERSYINKIQKYHPSLVFKLILSPQESIRRKPFENLSAVTQKHEITKQLQFPNSSVYEIDAEQEFDGELLKIKEIVWRHLLKDH